MVEKRSGKKLKDGEKHNKFGKSQEGGGGGLLRVGRKWGHGERKEWKSEMSLTVSLISPKTFFFQN